MTSNQFKYSESQNKQYDMWSVQVTQLTNLQLTNSNLKYGVVVLFTHNKNSS